MLKWVMFVVGGGAAGMLFLLWSLWHITFAVRHLKVVSHGTRRMHVLLVENTSGARLTAYGPVKVIVRGPKKTKRPLHTHSHGNRVMHGSAFQVVFVAGAEHDLGSFEVLIRYQNRVHRLLPWLRERTLPWSGVVEYDPLH